MLPIDSHFESRCKTRAPVAMAFWGELADTVRASALLATPTAQASCVSTSAPAAAPVAAKPAGTTVVMPAAASARRARSRAALGAAAVVEFGAGNVSQRRIAGASWLSCVRVPRDTGAKCSSENGQPGALCGDALSKVWLCAMHLVLGRPVDSYTCDGAPRHVNELSEAEWICQHSLCPTKRV